jgi:hypothetical protein
MAEEGWKPAADSWRNAIPVPDQLEDEPIREDGNGTDRPRLFVIYERDVGLFSLFQQVVANIPRALANQAVPIVCFGSGCAYFRPDGYRGRDTVWEYYFEPLVRGYDASLVCAAAREAASRTATDWGLLGFEFDDRTTFSNNFGHHPELCGQALRIPYEVADPDAELRKGAAKIIRQFVRPRKYIREKVDAWCDQELAGQPFIGVHVRGTDAISSSERRDYRQGSLQYPRIIAAIEAALARHQNARVVVATDDAASLDTLQREFGDRIAAYASIRHDKGPAAGRGPSGAIMPAYVSDSPDTAAINGEEAIIEYLLLCRSMLLIHNGAGLARSVMLTEPSKPHINTHGQAQTSSPVSWHPRRIFKWFVDDPCPQVPPGLDRLLKRARNL